MTYLKQVRNQYKEKIEKAEADLDLHRRQIQLPNPSVKEDCPICESEFYSQFNSLGQKRCHDCGHVSPPAKN